MGIVVPTIGQAAWGQPLNDALSGLQDGGLSPSDAGFLSWNYSPQHISTVTSSVTSGTVKMMRLPRFTQPKTVTSVWACVVAAAVTPTAGQCFAALFNMAGTRMAVSADISGQLSASGGTMVGWAMTAPVVCPVGDYYTAILQNAATPATFGHCSGVTYTDALNAGLPAATAFHTDGPTAQTSMPASVTMASRSRSVQPIWTGVK